MIFPKRGSSTYKLLMWTLTGFTFTILGVIILRTEANFFSFGDFPQYWAAGRLQLLNKNPYDPDLVVELRTQVGQSVDLSKPISMMIYPPWVLPLLLPLGVFPYKVSRILWLVLHIGILLYASKKVWDYYGGQEQKQWIAWLAVLTFFPTVLVLAMGHINPLFLIAVIIFINLADKKNPAKTSDFIAGSLLLIAVTKYHLLYLFLLAVFIWVITNKRWMVILGACISGLILTALANAITPEAISQYFSLLRMYPWDEWATPTLGAFIRFIIGIENFWVQFLPPLLGATWLLYYWLKHRHTWSWLDQTPLIVLISTTTFAYGWTYDYIILLLPILQTIALLTANRENNYWNITILVSILIIINLLVLYLHSMFSDFWFFWLAPLLLIWYLIANYDLNRKTWSFFKGLWPERSF